MLNFKTLGVVALLTMSSCLSTGSRSSISNMSEEEFTSLRDSVFSASSLAGRELGEGMDEDQARVGIAVASSIRIAVAQDEFGVDDIVEGIVLNLSDEMQLDDEEVLLIQDVGRIIDAAVGQIRLGIDGSLSPREQELLFALLDGLANGLGRAHG